MKAVMLAALAGMCWGVGEVFTKSALHSGKIGPLTAIAVRSTVALPALWLAFWIAGPVLRREPQGWLHSDGSALAKLIIGSGLIAGAGGMICFYAALSVGDVSRVKPIAFGVAPAVGVLLGWLVLREPMTLSKALGALLILAGVVLLTGGPRLHPPGALP